MEKVSADFYDEDYFENGITSSKSGYNGYHWNDSISMNAKDLIREFNPKRVLDVGCAKGYLVTAFRRLGVDAWGVEISKYAYENAHEEAKYFIINTSIDELTEELGEFDLVIFYDILEHLTDQQIEKVMQLMNKVKAKFITLKCPFEVYDWDADKSHINIKSEKAWIELFSLYGYKLYLPSIPKAPWTWWDNRTLLFKRGK